MRSCLPLLLLSIHACAAAVFRSSRGLLAYICTQQPAAETTAVAIGAAAAAVSRWMDAMEDAVSDARQALTDGYERVTGQA